MAPDLAPDSANRTADALDIARVRESIRRRRKLRIRYRDDGGSETRRVIWPIAVAYFERVQLIIAWCELRQAFRHFRTDRIRVATFLTETIPTSAAVLRTAWREANNSRNS